MLLAASTAACSVTLPVQGAIEDGSEAFTGSATGYMDRSGTPTITSNKGLSCTGDFVYVTERQGKGTFRCTNGQSGPFALLHCTKGANLTAGDRSPAGKVKLFDAVKLEGSVFLQATANEFDIGNRQIGNGVL